MGREPPSEPGTKRRIFTAGEGEAVRHSSARCRGRSPAHHRGDRTARTRQGAKPCGSAAAVEIRLSLARKKSLNYRSDSCDEPYHHPDDGSGQGLAAVALSREPCGRI